MKPFRYEQPADMTSAITMMLDEPGAAYLAGGTNLVDLMKVEVATPDLLIDVRTLTSDQIEDLPDGGLRIGAAVSNSEIAADRRIRRDYSMLSQAILAGASYQLRNWATAGGNLLQRTRCAYFQDVEMPCNKREPGTGCSALQGHHRDLAIIGHSPSCVATFPSDMAVPLAALDAVVRVQGLDGERTIPLTEFHRLPEDTPERDNVLDRGELITAIDLPPFAANSAYRKIRDRASYAFALVSVAAALEIADGVIKDVRIALGGVAHKPWRAWEAERRLRGLQPTEETFRVAAEAELAQARPLRDNGFKVPLARNVIVRMLSDLAEVGQ
ncbi:xanthine dehydrogenase family protein subunit M [Kibdelosporangium aridum]|uniref:Xanthine dehydrogenase family protein subunit M n=1 Tax=Kibdelosporangium aridum TaxID=2030 RepID=A0A428Z9K9_KIBAR|nr:xanthine dehydrogenase family protein subunit M [Kibdelosporangium aridum]RSM84741.1 xanthine dehydrogenase family protein subunit M [Kibdelosporangium aridum]